MSRETGQDIAYEEHLRQSIRDIITTPLGSRVAVRDYGSLFHELLDRVVDRQWVIDGFLAIATALDRWEPRFKLTRVGLDGSQLSDGIVALSVFGVDTILSKVIVLENITLDFGAPV